MRVDWFIPCRYVEVNGNLITIVSGNINHLLVPSLPAPEPLQVLGALRVVADHEEIDDEPQDEPPHQMVCRVYGPSMNMISELEQPFGLQGEFSPDEQPAAVMPIGVIFQPELEGQHTIEIAIDGRGQSVSMKVELAPRMDY